MLKIGIIEDEENARRVIKKYLDRSVDNYEIVFEASEYQNAIDLSLEFKPDIILLDIHLNGQSGIEIAKFLKNKINSKIIFTTADRKYVLKAIKVNVFDYLLKPIDSDELKETISRAMAEIEKDKLKTSIKTNEITSQIFEKVKVLDSNTISYIKAEGSYSEIKLKNGEIVTIKKSIEYIGTQIENNTELKNSNTDETVDKNNNELILEDNVKIPNIKKYFKMVIDFFQPKQTDKLENKK